MYLSGINYQLGEQIFNYNETENFDSFLMQYNISDKPEYWGWGNYRKTAQSIYHLLKSCIQRTIDDTLLDPGSIDLIIFCSAGSGEYYHTVNEKLGVLFNELKIQNPIVIGQAFTGCVSIFSAIKLAESLFHNNLYKTILVVTADKVPQDVVRFREFALYSDAASSFLLSSSKCERFEIINSTIISDSNLMAGLGTNPDRHFQLLNITHKKVIEGFISNVSELNKIFITNLYKPLVQINTMRLGYSNNQCFFDNIEKNGHCFSSDPFINLIDFIKGDSNDSLVVDHYMLGAMASGHAGFCIVKDTKTI